MVLLTRRAGLAGLVALALLVAPAAPVRAGPVIDETGPEIAIVVTLSETGAADPDLRAFLMAEIEATVAQYRELAREAAAAARAAGRPFRPFDLSISHEDRYVSAEYVSVLRTTSDYTGGAHGNTFVEPITLDRRTGAFVRLDDLLGGPAGGKALQDISAFLRVEIIRRHHGGNPETPFARDVAAATVPDLSVLSNFTLEAAAEDGRIAALAFHFSPYEVAPYSEGPVEIVVPATLFAAGLKPAVAPRFGGTPRR